MPVMCPLPSHLAKNLKLDEESNQNLCKGQVVCDCLNEDFEIYFYGELHNKIFKSQVLHPLVDELDQSLGLALIAKCKKCGKEILIFDNNIHSYDSYFKKKQAVKRHLYQKLTCSKCNKTHFTIEAEFAYIDKDSFEEIELLKVNKSEVSNYFDWIKVKLICSSCDKGQKDFIDFETT